MNIDKKRIEDFWKMVDKNDKSGCWIFLGTPSLRYGRIQIGQTSFAAHRLSYMIHFGDIPENMLVCHKCDVTKCVNPGHLFLGTHKDNSNDKISKNRQRFLKGSEKPDSKMNEESIVKMRNEYAEGNISQRDLAKKYNMSKEETKAIVLGQTWKHVGGTLTRKNHIVTNEEKSNIKLMHSKGINAEQIGKILEINPKSVRYQIGKMQ